MTTCAYCDGNVKNPTHKTCGAPECRRLANNARAKRQREQMRANGLTFDMYRKKMQHQCAHCGDTFKGIAAAKYCGMACNTAAATAASKAAAKRRAVERSASRLLPVPYTPPVYARATRHIQAQAKLDRAAAGTTAKSAKVSSHCVICNTHYVTVWYGNHATTRTCSAPCAKGQTRNIRRLGHERRRAREKNAFVANVYRKRVFERDRWRCHICRKKTNKDAVVPHPQAPTIDHLIPLASGGTHEPANVATACFKCNHTKGARGSGEQLALIG